MRSAAKSNWLIAYGEQVGEIVGNWMRRLRSVCVCVAVIAAAGATVQTSLGQSYALDSESSVPAQARDFAEMPDDLQANEQGSHSAGPRQVSDVACVVDSDVSGFGMLDAGAQYAGGTDASGKLGDVSIAASPAHATATLYGVQFSPVITRTATVNFTGNSINCSGGDGTNTCHFKSFSASFNGNGLPGGVVAEANTGDGWPTAFRMYLTGTAAAAYNIVYHVHGWLLPGNGGAASNGGWASHANACIDGVRAWLTIKPYEHTVQARFQQADGSWSAYSLQASRSYGYLQIVPEWVRAEDDTYSAASVGAYTSSYSSVVKYVDVPRKTYTASFDTCGGDEYPPLTALAGAALPELPVPAREGFEFAGWYTDPVGGSSVVAGSAMPHANTVFYAHWTRVGHIVDFDANGGEGASYDRAVVPLGESWRIPNCPFTRYGYVFSGWSAQANGAGEKFEAGRNMVLGSDVTLFAQWEPVDLEVGLPTEEGLGLVVNGTGRVTSEGSGARLINRSMRGVEICGMFVRPSAGCAFVADPARTGEIDLRFAPEGGHAIALSQLNQEAYQAPAYPHEWRLQAGETLGLMDTSGLVGIMAGQPDAGWCYGAIQWKYKLSQTTVTFSRPNEAGGVISQSANVGDELALPDNCFEVPDGMAFAGWSTSANGQGELLSPSSIVKTTWDDLNLYAMWR